MPVVEAADLAPRLARIAGAFGVPVYSGGGFDGLKGKREFASRAMQRDVPTIVLHVGDRDDHGDDIYVAAAEDAVAWAGAGRVSPLDEPGTPGSLSETQDEDEPGLLFYRLALTVEQAEEHRLLDADGKAEVDGVPVAVMDAWLADAIDALQVPARREELVAVQEIERERLPDAIREALDAS